MNIYMLLAENDFPPDIRVEKEARALSEAGHKIVIVCEQFLDRPSQSQWHKCQIRRVPPLKSKFIKGVNWLIKKILFYDWHWNRFLSRFLKEEKVDVLHVHDLPMVGTALSLGKRYGIPVLADLHENYSAGLQYYYAAKPWQNLILRIFDAPRWPAYERRCVMAADHVLVVVDEAKERLRKLGASADKITVIENTPGVDYFTRIPLDEDLIRQYRNDFIISYLGGFGGVHRGLPLVIEAMPEILAEIPNARLLLVGGGPIKPQLEAMATERSLKDRVTFVDWQPFERVPSYVAMSSVCLVPHDSNPHTEATSPHKLFQYMLMGKPVIVSTCKPLRRIIEETGSGLIFQAGNKESLVQSVVQLKDARLRQKLGHAGRNAVLEKYSWERTSKELLKVYENLGKK